jgi:hypothetical protein
LNASESWAMNAHYAAHGRNTHDNTTTLF